MDLSALLAREGIGPGDVEALLKWARQRSHTLVARIEPGSPLAEMLGANLERAPEPGAATPQPAARSAPRPIARSVSRPYLNAAVAAALSGKQEDIDLALENVTAADDEPLPELPVLEDTPEPEPPPPADDDPLIGGFSRFAFAMRRRAPEPAAPEPPPPRSGSLSRGFELHAEAQTPRSWDDEHVPEPPGFEARLSESARMHLANLDAESSGGLVLGIPDDDSDIPVFRPRPRSQGNAVDGEASSSMLTDAVFDAMIEPSLLEPVTSEVDSPPTAEQAPEDLATPTSGPHASAEPDAPHPTQALDSSPTAAAGPTSGPTSGAHAAALLDLGPTPAASGPHIAAHPISGPAPAASGPHAAAHPASGPTPAASGPHAAAHPVSGPAPAASGPHAAAHPASGPAPAASGPHAAAHPVSGPAPAASGPHTAAPPVSGPAPAASGPQPPARPVSGPAPTASAPPRQGPPPPPPPRPASAPIASASRTPPPPPPNRRGGKKTLPQPVVAAAAKPAAKPESGKKGKHRKKVVELSQPVVRPVSAPSAAAAPRPATQAPVSLARPVSNREAAPTPTPTPKPAPAPRTVPDYLRDDED